MAGLHYLKRIFNLSDELTVERWTENPYWQYFCGMKYFEHEMPIHSTSRPAHGRVFAFRTM